MVVRFANFFEIDHALRGKKKEAWKTFQLVATNFLGNKADNYKLLVENLLKA